MTARSSAIVARQDRRRKHAAELLDEYDSGEWGGSTPIDQLAGCRFAVVVERDSDSWVVGVDDAAGIAAVELACCSPDGDEAEWVVGAVDLVSGEDAGYSARVTVEVTMADGAVAEVSSR